MLHTDACKTMYCHSFEILVPVLCKSGVLVMLTGWDFLCRWQNGVNPVVANFLFCVI